jgi:hypothetical protein
MHRSDKVVLGAAAVAGVLVVPVSVTAAVVVSAVSVKNREWIKRTATRQYHSAKTWLNLDEDQDDEEQSLEGP